MDLADDALADAKGNLGDWLAQRFQTAEVAAIRTSFFTVAGACHISRPAKALLQRGGRFHAVLGGTPEQTEGRALETLMLATEDFPDRATVLLALPDVGLQNAKTYYFRDPSGRAYAYVGSGNLTNGGLVTNHEAGVYLDSEDGTRDQEMLDRIHDATIAWASREDAFRATPGVAALYREQGGLHLPGRVHRRAASRPVVHIADCLPPIADRLLPHES